MLVQGEVDVWNEGSQCSTKTDVNGFCIARRKSTIPLNLRAGSSTGKP